jgi:hypothetical protein
VRTGRPGIGPKAPLGNSDDANIEKTANKQTKAEDNPRKGRKNARQDMEQKSSRQKFLPFLMGQKFD